MTPHERLVTILVLAGIVIAGAFQLGRWFQDHLHEAEVRRQGNYWQREVAPHTPDQWPAPNPTIVLKPEPAPATQVDLYQPDEWVDTELPPTRYGAYTSAPNYVFAASRYTPAPYVTVTDPERTYDPEADTRAFMNRQNEDLREYLRKLRES